MQEEDQMEWQNNGSEQAATNVFSGDGDSEDRSTDSQSVRQDRSISTSGSDGLVRYPTVQIQGQSVLVVPPPAHHVEQVISTCINTMWLIRTCV